MPDRHEADRHEEARDLAEQGLDKLVEGDKQGKKLIDKAKRLDPAAVEELAQEIEDEAKQAERQSGQ